MHKKLMEKSKWYAKWHGHSLHKSAHWLSFAIIVSFVATALVAQIQASYNLPVALDKLAVQNKEACLPYAFAALKPGFKELKTENIKVQLRKFNESIFQTNNSLSIAKTAKQSSLVLLAKERKNLLVSLMEKNPLAALDVILANAESNAIAGLTKNCVERSLIVNGKLFLTHYDFFDDKNSGQAGESKNEYAVVTSDGKKYTAHIATSLDDESLGAALGRGENIRVKGFVVDDHFLFNTFEPNNFTIVEESEVSQNLAKNSEGRVLGAATGPVKVAVIVANVSDASVSSSVSQIQSTMSEVANFYTENSYGQLNLQNSVFGPYTLPINLSECTLDRLRSEAVKTADSGIYYPDYGQIVIIAPSACPIAGAGVSGWVTMTTNDGYIQKPAAVIQDMTTRIIGHEMGHSFGSGHSSMLFCDNGPAFAISETTGCEVVGYGDKYSIMDSNLGHFNVPEKSSFEWLSPTAFQEVTVDGTYVIKPIETSGDGLKGIKIRRAANDYIYVEYRQPIGFDANLGDGGSDVFGGALVHTHNYTYNYTTGANSMLLNMEPESSLFNANLTVSLKPGKTFTDPTNGISVTVVSKTASSLTVSVNVENPDVIIPTIAITNPQNQQQVSGIVNVTATLTENRAIQKVKYVIGGQTFIVTQAPYSLQWDTTALPNGTVSMYAWIQDTSGNNSTAPTQWVTVNNVIYDPIPPTVSLVSPVNGSSGASPVLFSANASDNISVDRVEFHYAGPLTAYYSDSFSPYNLSQKLTPGSYTLFARAYDDAGNMSQTPSVSFTVAEGLPDTTPPAVSITAPPTGSALSGVVNVTASASDNLGVSGVQFLLDGANLGTEDASASYSYSWNTSSASNGPHTLAARARDAAGNKTTSIAVSVTTNNLVLDTTPPTAPSGLSVKSFTSNQIALSWIASTDNVGVAGYNVYRNGSKIAFTSGTNYTDSTVLPATSYDYTAQAYDAAGNLSAFSNAVSVRTLAVSLSIGRPRVSNKSGNSVIISWTTNLPSLGSVKFGISSTNLNSTVFDVNAGTSHSVILTGLNSLVKYYYQISAVGEDGVTTAATEILNFKTTKK